MPIQTDLSNKVAVVTGGSKGIGAAIALRLAQEGAKVLITGRHQKSLNDVVKKLNELRPGCTALTVDVRQESDVQQLLTQAYETYDEVHILVNNAGIYPVTPLANLSVAEWEDVVNTNLTGAFMCSKLFAAAMIEKKTEGRIVNISSTSSQIARPGIIHYATTKAGLNMMTKVLAVELAPNSITVNAVCPGVIATDTVIGKTNENPENKAEHQSKLKRIPLGRLGEPEEIASAALFLVSDEARYVTGATLFVDGGYTLGIPNYS